VRRENERNGLDRVQVAQDVARFASDQSLAYEDFASFHFGALLYSQLLASVALWFFRSLLSVVDPDRKLQKNCRISG